MSEKKHMGIRRDQIPWFPTINYEKCLASCDKCARLCGFGVFEFDAEKGKAIVKNPYACTVGCRGCTHFCPADAIGFPNMDEIKKLIAKLRENMPELI